MPPPEELFQSRSKIATRASVEPETKLQIWIPYVGQGDGTLVIMPNGKNLLIDAGPPGAGMTHLLPLLQKLKIQTIDALVVSHYDLDHLGGVPEIPLGLDGIPNTPDDVKVIEVYDRGGEPWDNSPGYGSYLGSLEEWKIPRISLKSGDTLTLDLGVSILCVAVNGIVSDGSSAPLITDISLPSYSGRENAASIALLLEFGSFRYLTAGDLTGGGMTDGFLTPNVETEVAKVIGAVDALHANHHGSLSSSNIEFIQSTRPDFVFIQAGENNQYRHPHPSVLDQWNAISAEIYLTQENEHIGLGVFANGKVEIDITKTETP